MCHAGSCRFADGTNNPKTGKQWLDVKVFCVRLHPSGFSKTVQIPESLTLHFLPRSIPTAMEINGRRFHPPSSAFITLQRDRVEEKSEGEITFVGTDTFRVTDNLCFEVYLRNDPLIFGTLEKRWEISEDLLPETTWSVDCSSRLEYSSTWPFNAMAIPTVDVYVAGRISGLPMIISQTLQLLPRRKHFRDCTLDVIPEGNETLETYPILNDAETESDDSESSSLEYDSGCDCDWIEGEEQGDSWIESGLRLGIGISLGMCIGVGVGLLVRTYQGTFRSLRKQIL